MGKRERQSAVSIGFNKDGPGEVKSRVLASIDLANIVKYSGINGLAYLQTLVWLLSWGHLILPAYSHADRFMAVLQRQQVGIML